jgi:hypothetical protein
MVRLCGVGLIALAIAAVASAQGDGAFQTGIRSYLDLRGDATAGVASTAMGAEVLEIRQRTLAQRIQSKRQNARQGDVLGPVALQIRELVGREITGPQGAAMLSTVEQTNVHGVRARVNRRYPPALPRVTMPASLLAKLPSVPNGLEYRFLGRSLLLVDTDAALVVDLIPDVLPPPQSPRASSNFLSSKP